MRSSRSGTLDNADVSLTYLTLFERSVVEIGHSIRSYQIYSACQPAALLPMFQDHGLPTTTIFSYLELRRCEVQQQQHTGQRLPATSKPLLNPGVEPGHPHLPHRPFPNIPIILSTSTPTPPVAIPLNSSNFPRSFAFSASSAAAFTNPHLTHISILSLTAKCVHFGIYNAATFGLPAPNISLK